METDTFIPGESEASGRMGRRQIRTFGIALAAALGLVAWGKGLAVRPYLVSDMLCLTGLVLLMIGAAGLVSNSGLFRLVSYSTKLFTDLLLNRPRQGSVVQSDYVRYLERPRQKHTAGLPLAGGVICLLASALAAIVTK